MSLWRQKSYPIFASLKQAIVFQSSFERKIKESGVFYFGYVHGIF